MPKQPIIEHILNDALNKALCSKNRIQRPNSNNIAEFVSKYLEAINYTHCCEELSDTPKDGGTSYADL
tara:strand:+ start:267 stop:470 length:204 start_codon:yes stop_codon:yes gene_type:complete